MDTFHEIDRVLSPYMVVFLVAWIGAIIATPIMRAVAFRYGILDRPDQGRKHHTQAIAYLGGVAILIGWLAGVFSSSFIEPHTSTAEAPIASINFPISILLGAVVITFVGLLDDVIDFKPAYKITGQLVAAGILVYSGMGTQLGAGIVTSLSASANVDPETIRAIGGGVAVLDPAFLIGSGIVVALVLGCSNSTNLLDGLDGLASGVIAIAGFGLTVIAVCLAMGIYENQAYSLLGDPIRLVACMALLGAVLGFLPYNFHPANIFMGDAGSMLLGYLGASTILLFGGSGDPDALKLLTAGLVVFAVPIIDTVLAIARRHSLGMPLFGADNFHMHHQFIREGFTVRQAVAVLYVMSIGFMLFGCSLLFLRFRYTAALFLVSVGFISIMAFKIGHRQYHAERAEGEEELDTQPIPFEQVASDGVEMEEVKRSA
ncbi:MAG: glycosyltransferase family 4 protein [Planctomycetota bacterium]|jgi:UDP-GlcNAc:undecaprenyl-phosphate GlcNAc-1-phosphate transferase